MVLFFLLFAGEHLRLIYDVFEARPTHLFVELDAPVVHDLLIELVM